MDVKNIYWLYFSPKVIFSVCSVSRASSVKNFSWICQKMSVNKLLWVWFCYSWLLAPPSDTSPNMRLHYINWHLLSVGKGHERLWISCSFRRLKLIWILDQTESSVGVFPSYTHHVKTHARSSHPLLISTCGGRLCLLLYIWLRVSYSLAPAWCAVWVCYQLDKSTFVFTSSKSFLFKA